MRVRAKSAIWVYADPRFIREPPELLQMPPTTEAPMHGDAGDAFTARSTEPVHVRAADEHGFRTETQSLDDIATAADAAIQEYLDPVTNGSQNFRQHTNGRGNTIKLTATMIRHDNTVDTPVRSTAGVFRRVHPFCDDRALPLFANPI